MRRAMTLVGLGAGLGAALALLAYVGLLGWARGSGPGRDLPPAQTEALETLGAAALETRDIPVAALLVYEGEIIGRGHNTVRRDGNAGGHAEINAISDALGRLGSERFAALDREELELVSTFEPCPMCQGALAMWDIRKVSFLRAKTVGRQLELERRRLRHLVHRAQRGPVELQQRLFLRHPEYPGRTSTASEGARR